MVAAVIASLAVSTLVLVDRKALAEQWRTRLHALPGIKVGQRGGARGQSRRVCLGIATQQTLGDYACARRSRSRGLPPSRATAGGFVAVKLAVKTPSPAVCNGVGLSSLTRSTRRTSRDVSTRRCNAPE